MFDSDSSAEFVLVDLGDGVIAKAEVTDLGRESVGAGTLSFEGVAKAITKISQFYASSIQEIRPTKATLKYGLAISVEQGSLMAALVRGTGTANLEVTLEWENSPNSNESQKRKLPPNS